MTYVSFYDWFRTYRKQIIGISKCIFLKITTVMPVEVRWSHAESITAWALPVFCLYGMTCLFLSTRNTACFKLSICDMLMLAGALYYFFRVWIGKEYPCATQFIKDTGMFVLYFTLRPIFSPIKVQYIHLSIIFVLFGCYEALNGFFQITMGGSRHPAYVFTGPFLNPGPYSAYLLVTLIIGILSKNDVFLLIKEVATKYFGYLTGLYNFVLAILGIMLLSTWSRSAILTFAVFSLWHYRKKYWRWRYIVWAACVGFIIGLYFMKQGSADGRILTWIASLKTWMHDPWLGVGIGGFRHACAQGVSELFTVDSSNPLFFSGNVSEYAFCDMLKILTEQGILGLALFIVVILSVLYNVFHYSRSLFCTMLALLAFSLFSYPFELYPYRVMAIMIAAIIPHHFQIIRFRGWKRNVTLMLYGLIFVSMSTFIAKEVQLRQNADKESELFIGLQNEAFIHAYYKLLQKENDNPQYLFQFAKVLRGMGRYNDSNAILSNGILISNDPMFYLLQGNNYKDMGFPHFAEQVYFKAHAVMPNRLYPLYQLMVLYESVGQKGKMKKMAKRIIEMKPKITSPATEEMKQKAKIVL